MNVVIYYSKDADDADDDDDDNALYISQRIYSVWLIFIPGMKKINFSGGEPFIQARGKYVGDLVVYCKQELQLESVSIVTNGSLVKEGWFVKYGK